ncbi:MAG: tetratricopeptide repeat protein [Acidobacteria bacterium]|nr:MAG: tetratricopeptide repeat protein [Acidobacteriota bacterium]
MTTRRVRYGAATICLLMFVLAALARAQAPAQNKADNSARQAAESQDHAAAYYHYMLAQRYKDLAGIYNRSDYVDRAITEYQKAIAADPGSLFLRVQLGELYWRVSRIEDAVNEVQSVLKDNPDDVQAHRLLARIYFSSMGDSNSGSGTPGMLEKTIAEFEAVHRLDPDDADSALMLGRLYKADNQPKKAEALFEKVLSDNPDSRNVLVNLTQLYFDQGDYDKIISLLENVPDSRMDPALLYLLGSSYAQTRDLKKAEDVFKKALDREPDSEDIRRAYAESLMAEGKTEEARSQLQEIVKSDPQSPMSYVRLAQLDRQMGNFEDARKELEQARGLAPDNLEIPYQQAVLEDTLGNETKAISLLQEVLKKTEKPDGKYNPAEANNRAIYLQRMGTIYRSQEDYDKAIETYQGIVALGGDQAPRGEALIVETLQLDQKNHKAMQAAETALKKYPKNRELLMQRASLLGQEGHRDEAVAQLENMLTGNADDRDIYLSIAQIYSQAKTYAKAEEVIQKALALSNNPDDQEYARFLLGSVYEREKRFDLAEEQFRKVLDADPLNDAAANYLGYMLADRGVRLDESVKYIKDALRIEPNNGAYLDSLGWAYHKMNRNDMAQSPLEKAVKLIPNDPTIREHLGYVYLALGEKAKALQEWEHALKFQRRGVSGDFGAQQAAKLRKQVNNLKHEIGQPEAAVGQN